MCLSIHPCICPSLCSSSHPSIYLAIHEFIWTWTLLAIFRSSDPCVHLSFHLPVVPKIQPSTVKASKALQITFISAVLCITSSLPAVPCAVAKAKQAPFFFHLDSYMQHMPYALCSQRNNADAQALQSGLAQKHANIKTFKHCMTTLCRADHIILQVPPSSKHGRQCCRRQFLQTKNIMLGDHFTGHLNAMAAYAN